MSSVVNKSSTKFVPKLRQRRLLSSAEPPKRATTAALMADDPLAVGKNEEVREKFAESAIDGQKVAERTRAVPHFKNSFDPSEAATTTHLPDANTSTTKPRRRSSRLDSLSGASGKSMFTSSFLDRNSPLTPSVVSLGRRLSTMSSSGLKKIEIKSISENDSALKELKKRRMSARLSVSNKKSSVHKINIVANSLGNEEDEDNEDDSIPYPKRKRESTSDIYDRADAAYTDKYTVRAAKDIPKKMPDSDSSKYMIDEENFTLAELCKPKLPIGEISDNFARAEQARKAKFEKRKQRRELRQRAREEFKSLQLLNKEDDEKAKMQRKKAAEELLNSDIPDSAASHGTIQLKLNPDGQMVVDEETTVVDRHRNARLENAQKEKVNENPFENLYNSSTYGRNIYTDPWTNEEVIKFYRSLSMWGTDFNLIAQLFPYRTRKQIKAKFVNEERKNPVIIELALRSRLPPDFDEYCEEIRHKLGTVDDFDEEMKRLRIKHEEHMKQIEESKALAKNEDLTTNRQVKNKASGIINTGKKSSGGLLTEQLKTYRKSEIVLGTIDQMKKRQVELGAPEGT